MAFTIKEFVVGTPFAALVYDPNSLSWVRMEQPVLEAGSVTVGGAVDQGTPGASAWLVDGSGVIQPISASSLPLPSGAASETTLSTLEGKVPALVSGQIPIQDKGVENLYTNAYDYDGSNNLIYLGRAAGGSSKASAVWQIKKFTYSGSNLTDTQWADGDQAFDNIWNDRAGLSYS